MNTDTTSNRTGPGGTPKVLNHLLAARRIRAIFPGVTDSAGVPQRKPDRVLTSQTINVRPS